ncbi:MAG: hypothetical protein V8S08_03020 [Lachnoclostridium sp.]
MSVVVVCAVVPAFVVVVVVAAESVCCCVPTEVGESVVLVDVVDSPGTEDTGSCAIQPTMVRRRSKVRSSAPPLLR